MASILATGCFSMEVVGRGVMREKTEWGRWEKRQDDFCGKVGIGNFGCCSG